MSKMSQLHAELSEQASSLGFQSIEEAEANGYIVKYSGEEAFLVQDTTKMLDNAHEEWLKERDRIIKKLETCVKALEQDGFGFRAEAVEEAIEFIKKGEV